MTRREALRRAMLMATATSLLTSVRVLYGQGGQLRVPLDQWQTVTFEFKGKRVAVSTSDIFEALLGGPHQ